jgi:hypothetical protein
MKSIGNRKLEIGNSKPTRYREVVLTSFRFRLDIVCARFYSSLS